MNNIFQHTVTTLYSMSLSLWNLLRFCPKKNQYWLKVHQKNVFLSPQNTFNMIVQIMVTECEASKKSCGLTEKNIPNNCFIITSNVWRTCSFMKFCATGQKSVNKLSELRFSYLVAKAPLGVFKLNWQIGQDLSTDL